MIVAGTVSASFLVLGVIGVVLLLRLVRDLPGGDPRTAGPS